MRKVTLLLLAFTLFPACSRHLPQTEATKNNDHYFADATECFKTAHKKEQINLNMTGNKDNPFVFPIMIDIPLGVTDAVYFKNCMRFSGHESANAETQPTAFLELSKRCLYESRGESNRDEVYANCIKNGKLSVELIEFNKKTPNK